MLALKIIIFTLLVPGTVTVWVPYFVLRAYAELYPPTMDILTRIGLLLIVGGILTYVWCAVEFARGQGTPAPIDPPKELVVKGLYRFTRNPIYIGVLAILFGEALLFRSLPLLAYALGTLAVFHLFVRFYEERTLHRRFGDAYVHYSARVPRWFFRRRSH